MSAKYLIPAVLATLLATGASAATTTDPVRARVVAELEQARQSGHFPPSEADYVYPNWVHVANPAGVVMTDGHPELQGNTGTASRVAASTETAAPAVAIMSDGHPELENTGAVAAARQAASTAPAVALMSDAPSGSVKGGDSAQ